MWYYLMDPVVDSIVDAKKGIHNPDKWNNEMPPSDADLVRYRNTKIFLTFTTLALSLCLLA